MGDSPRYRRGIAGSAESNACLPPLAANRARTSLARQHAVTGAVEADADQMAHKRCRGKTLRCGGLPVPIPIGRQQETTRPDHEP